MCLYVCLCVKQPERKVRLIPKDEIFNNCFSAGVQMCTIQCTIDNNVPKQHMNNIGTNSNIAFPKVARSINSIKSFLVSNTLFGVECSRMISLKAVCVLFHEILALEVEVFR